MCRSASSNISEAQHSVSFGLSLHKVGAFWMFLPSKSHLLNPSAASPPRRSAARVSPRTSYDPENNCNVTDPIRLRSSQCKPGVCSGHRFQGQRIQMGEVVAASTAATPMGAASTEENSTEEASVDSRSSTGTITTVDFPTGTESLLVTMSALSSASV